MYNAELKEKFLMYGFSTLKSRRIAAMVLFNTIEKYEKIWEADICTRSKSELQPVIDEIVGIRAQSRHMRLNILKEYVRWCIRNGVEGACDGLLQISSTGIDKIKRQMVSNPRHLQRFLDCIYDFESEETVDCIYRCFYWLAYIGLKEEDALNLTKENVDLSEMLIIYNGREYMLCREAMASVKKCMTLTQFRFKHPNFSDDKHVYKDRYIGKALLRGMGNTNSITSMRAIVSRRIKEQRYRDRFSKDDTSVDLKLSYYKVWLSGLFHRMYEVERAGMTVDFMDAAAERMEGVTYNLSSGRNTLGAKKRQIARDYLEDYNRWKEAFSI